MAARDTAAQDSAEEVGRAFFRALGSLQWERVADRLHSGALDEFRLVSRLLVESRAGDSVLVRLYDATLAEWQKWSPRETFVRSMEGLTRFARGLMESQVTSDFEILGSVPDGDSVRHVVYREATDHAGMVIDGVLVLTLLREEGEWRARENAELDVLQTALRGIPVMRREPAGGHGPRELVRTGGGSPVPARTLGVL